MSAETSRAGEADSSNGPDDKTFSCPSCDRSFDTDQGVKSHHWQAHNEKIGSKEYKCESCGKSFRKSHGNIKHTGEGRYCSMECQHEGLRKSQEVACEYCGDVVEKIQSEIDRAEHNFCSMSCHSDWMAENAAGENHHNADPSAYQEKTCEICDTTFMNKISSHSPGRFCSRDCMCEWQKTLTGEQAHNWEGGVSDNPIYYGPNWTQQAQKARDRDEYKCQCCGMDLSDKEREPDVHHIKKIRWFRNNYDDPEWYERGNRLENLRTICDDCHGAWEGVPVAPVID